VRTVIVYEVGYGNTEQGALEACVKTSNALTLYNFLDSLDDVGVGLLGLDLCSSGQSDQRVSAILSACCPGFASSRRCHAR
jgi:hypothetical protein